MMKLVYLTPFQFFGAIVIGILLSLTVGGMLMSPDPVSEPAQQQTPAVQPTPIEQVNIDDVSTAYGLVGIMLIIICAIGILGALAALVVE